ncbi:MAG: tRNA 2-selenouridine(34) synthase MnmH [Enterobacteriaceae bacterium]
MPVRHPHSTHCSDDYHHIVLSGVPLLDVRSPGEFERGALPQAENIPLLNDEERHQVGICYKEQGQEQAIQLGYRLLGNGVREQRLALWQAYCQAHPEGYLYCFRGGLRSHLVQEWLREAGLEYPLIKGGYKALRRYLLEVLQQMVARPMVLIGGNTGCGKTLMIRELAENPGSGAIDLEGLAHHRGSSFGRLLTPQSGQIDFEHRLAVALLHKQQRGLQRWIVEDEGRSIGSNHVPPEFYEQMQRAPVVVIDDPFEIRLQRLTEEYIIQMWHSFRTAQGEELGWQGYCDYLQHGLFAIRKRLGLERYQELLNLQQEALQIQARSGDSEAHRGWLIPLLKNYYDPMYTYQLNNKAQRIVWRGNYAEVKAYLLTHHGI